MEKTNNRLLVIDDERDIGEFIGEVAKGLGYDILVTADAKSFMDEYKSFMPDVVVVDVVMPETDGIELVKFLANHGCNARILVISGYAERYLQNTKSLAEAFGLPSVKTMTKPLELAALESFLQPAG